jgi:hypothetical protein
MAAAVANRPSNHAHQADAAASVDEADAPPHLHVAVVTATEKGTDTTVSYQARTQKKKNRWWWQCSSAWRAW